MKKILILSLAAVLSFSACSKQKAAEHDEASIPSAANADENTMGDSDSGRAMGMQTVHFGYDSFVLDASNKEILAANAKIMKENASVKIQIEGHCDARGGIQYNLALGEKRANATKKYMQSQGVPASRMTIISFGKEKLLDQGSSETANAANRRAVFVITSK